MYLALSIILFGYIGLTETRIFSIRTDIVPKAGYSEPVEILNDAAVDLKADFGFFRRQAEIDKLNADVDINRASNLIDGIPRQVLVFDGNLQTLNLSPSNDLLVSSKSWPDVSEEGDGKIGEETQRGQALAIYTKRIEDAVTAYNEILGIYIDDAFLSDRLMEAKENKKSFDLVSELQPSKNEYLKGIAEKAIPTLDNELTLLGLARENLNLLPTETQKDFGLNIGEGQVLGVQLSQNEVQNLAEAFFRNPALLNDGLSKYLPRIMFLMMPFAALIGLLFIRGKKTALLYDHLVHATYIHAVTFAFLFILILLAQWTPMVGSAQIFLVGILIYLPFSAKGMFRRSWTKTIFASYGIAALYGFVMFIVVTSLTAHSIVQTYEAGQVLRGAAT